MEELNLFITSIFIDNMIFSYFLGMCSFLAVSKNVKTAFGLGIAVTFMLVVTLPINYLLDNYLLKPGAMQWLGEEFATVDLSFLALIMFIAVIASMTQILAIAICIIGNFLAAYRWELRYSGMCIVHAATRLRVGLDGYGVWGRFGHRLDSCHRRACRYSREACLQQYSKAIARHWHNIYINRLDGHSFYELPRHKTLMAIWN